MTRRVFRWSPFVMVAILSPALLQIEQCPNPELKALRIEADGLNRVVGFNRNVTSYKIWTPASVDTIEVLAATEAGGATMVYRLKDGAVNEQIGVLGTGVGRAALAIPPGALRTLEIDSNHDGGLKRYRVEINPPCVADECNDANQCTSDACVSTACVFTNEANGLVCTFEETGDSTCDGGKCQPTVLDCGDVGSGSIAVLGETDSIRFDGQADDKVLVTTAQTSGFDNVTDLLTTVSSPTAEVLDSYLGNGHRLIELTQPGTHTIDLESQGLRTGTYNIGLACLDPASEDVPIPRGSVSTGAIGVPAEVDLYTFFGQDGDIIVLTTVETSGFGGSNDLVTTLYSPSGAVLLADSGNGRTLVTLPEAGEYKVSMRSEDLLGTGTYAIGLEGLNPASPNAVAAGPGDVFAATIDQAAEQDLYTFSGQAGDIVSLSAAHTSGFAGGSADDIRTELYSPSGSLLLSMPDSTRDQATLPESGTYVISVRSGNLKGTGSYGVGLEGLNPASPDAVAAGPGDVFAATIDQAAEQDLYTFSGQAGDIVSLSAAHTSGFAGGSADDIRTELYSPSGSLLLSMPDSTRDQATLPESGTYVISVRSGNLKGTGSYGVGLEGLNPASPDAVAAGPGDVFAATIDQAAEQDLYTFSGQAGDIVSLSAAHTSGFAGGSADDIRTELYSPSGSLLLSMPDSTRDQATLPESGTYVISVRSGNLKGTGSYGVGLEGLNPASPNAVAAGPGDVFAATIDQAAEQDLYTFSGQAGDIVSLSAAHTSGFAGGSADDIRTELYSPSGSLLLSMPDSTRDQATLPESGTYVISVRSGNLKGTGSYGVGLEGLNPASPDAVAAGPGDVFAATIDQAAEQDLYTFSGQAGDIVSLSAAHTSGFAGGSADDIRTELYSPSGSLLLSMPDSTRDQATLPESGTYVISVRSGNLKGTGSYGVGLEGLNPASPDAVAAGPGDVFAATIDQAAEQDLYTFSGQAGDEILLTATQTSGFGGAANIQTELYSPSGSLLLSIPENTQGQATLSEAGTHVISVRSGNLTGTGTYEVGFDEL